MTHFSHTKILLKTYLFKLPWATLFQWKGDQFSWDLQQPALQYLCNQRPQHVDTSNKQVVEQFINKDAADNTYSCYRKSESDCVSNKKQER